MQQEPIMDGVTSLRMTLVHSTFPLSLARLSTFVSASSRDGKDPTPMMKKLAGPDEMVSLSITFQFGSRILHSQAMFRPSNPIST
jgi:hypothetical protein